MVNGAKQVVLVDQYYNIIATQLFSLVYTNLFKIDCEASILTYVFISQHHFQMESISFFD